MERIYNILKSFTRNMESLEFKYREVLGKGICYDILISGWSLMDMFPGQEGRIVPLGIGQKDLACELYDLEFFTEPSRSADRDGFVNFLICGECHDEGCGVEDAKITFGERTVRWDQFFSHPEFSFEFDQQAYLDAFARLKERLIQKHYEG